MSLDIPVKFPAGFASVGAIAFTSESGGAVLVGGSEPLPVLLKAEATPAPIGGTTDESLLVGPYKPAAGRPVVVQLSGEWAGTVTLQRSTNAGATRLPVTAGGMKWGEFTANACEPVWVEQEAGAELYLEIELLQGSLSYRVSQ